MASLVREGLEGRPELPEFKGRQRKGLPDGAVRKATFVDDMGDYGDLNSNEGIRHVEVELCRRSRSNPTGLQGSESCRWQMPSSSPTSGQNCKGYLQFRAARDFTKSAS